MKRYRSQSAAKRVVRRKLATKNVPVYRTPAARVLASSAHPGYVAYSSVTAPDRTIVKMTYAQFNRLNSGVNVFAGQIYRGNSIFDPDLTGVGHQALSHDQWANFYEYYRVLYSTIEVTFVNQGTSPALCIIVPSEDGVTIDSGNSDTYAENPYAKKMYLAAKGGNDTCTLSATMKTAQILGVRRIDSGFDEAAAFGGNPSNAAAWFWHAYVCVRSGTPDVEIHTKIWYTVELLKRKQLGGS